VADFCADLWLDGFGEKPFDKNPEKREQHRAGGDQRAEIRIIQKVVRRIQKNLPETNRNRDQKQGNNHRHRQFFFHKRFYLNRPN
jgi:hypothetical protein